MEIILWTQLNSRLFSLGDVS
ncbi:protein of unknown function [Cyanobium sp. NIES-981]|nr:protein of unknown function [Cyanobium sp. NIES-981]